MPLESKFTEEQLFDNLISSLVHSVWVSLGKIKNPMTDKIDRNLFAASMNIDMLDMLYKKMDGNLAEQEETYLSRILSELKMNYLEEKKIGDDDPKEDDEKMKDSTDDKLPKEKKSEEHAVSKKQAKKKSTSAKPKGK